MWSGDGCCGGSDTTVTLTLRGTTLTANPGNSSVNIGVLPSMTVGTLNATNTTTAGLTVTSGTINLLDASGGHTLQSVQGNLFYDTELLARAGDIQDVSEWALYPAAQNIDMNANSITELGSINFQTGSSLYGVVNGVQTINGASGRNMYITANGTQAATITPGAVVVFDNAPQAADAPVNTADLTNKGYVDMAVAGWSQYPAGSTVIAPALDISGLTLSNVGGQLAVDGQVITTGSNGNAANWANYSAVTNVDMAGNDISGCGSFTAGGVLEKFTLGTGPLPMLAANIYATNVDIVGYAPTGNSVSLHGLNTVDIRSEDGDINVITGQDLNLTGGDINISSTDLTSVMNITAFGPATLSAASALLISGGAAVTVTAVGGLAMQAAGAASLTAGGAVSIAGGDYVEVNTGELQVINTTSGQSLMSVNNIQGNSHNGGDGTLSLTGHSVSGTLDMTNHDIINVNNLSANTITTTTPIQFTTIDLSGGASISTHTIGIATDLDISANNGSINLNSSYAIYPTAPEGMDMTYCDITNLTNVNGYQYLPTEMWSTRPAISTVDMSGNDISGAGTVTANNFTVPATGGGLSSYAGCPSIESGDAIYLRPKGTLIVQDASNPTPAPGGINAGVFEAVSLMTSPKYVVNGPSPIALTHTDGQILDVTDGAGTFEQVRVAAVNLTSSGTDLVMYKQSATRIAITDLSGTETVAYLSDLPVPTPLPAACFSSSISQTVSAADTPTPVYHNTADYNSGDFSLDASGNIVADVSGVFEIITSLQFNKTDSGQDSGYFWFRVNNVDIANSASTATLTGNNAAMIGTVALILPLNAGDVIELVMASSDTTFQIDALNIQASPYFRPANPSVITTIKKLEAMTTGTVGLGATAGGATTTMTQYKIDVPASTANIAAANVELGPVDGACYAVVGQDLSLNGTFTQTGPSIQKVYTWNDGSIWYLNASLSSCSSNAIETWTINIQKTSAATLTNTISAP